MCFIGYILLVSHFRHEEQVDKWTPLMNGSLLYYDVIIILTSSLSGYTLSSLILSFLQVLNCLLIGQGKFNGVSPILSIDSSKVRLLEFFPQILRHLFVNTTVLAFSTCSKHCQSQTGRARELTFWENVHPTLCVMCHVSCVMCHVSCVMCHVSRVTCHLSCVTCHMSIFFFTFFYLKKCKKTFFWHVTGDTWHVTHDTWHIVWDEHSLKMSAL